ncbi:MAG: hypothetical protein ACO1N4_12420 [Pedobacter sp.]
MIIFLSILFLALILYFLFFRKRKKIDIPSTSTNKEETYAESLSSSYKEKVYTDINGAEYKLVQKTKEIPRRTYIQAFLVGKYWGLIDEEQTEKYKDTKFFDFNIYEIHLKNALYSSNPFMFEGDRDFRRDKLPRLLPTTLQENGGEYNVNLHEPIVKDVKFERKLHQQDGKEIFGTVNAKITGYILDFVIETYTKKEYIINGQPIDILSNNGTKIIPTTTPTGNVEFRNNYKRIQYYNSDYKTSYWGNWKYYRKSSQNIASGCLATIYSIFLFVVILSGIINAFNKPNYKRSASVYPKPTPKKTETTIPKIQNTENGSKKKDTLITHEMTWQDYDGNDYQGKFWTKKSDYKQSNIYKNTLYTNDDYDKIIYFLKENDKEKLSGIYQMFDKIISKQNPSKNRLAEIIVSFVQHIPYAAILPSDCNPLSYQDDFLRKYLSSPDAKCDAFQKFGINTPVEFMTNLNGDCDTRTLLLYTMLSHYSYDVALLTSDYYRHSLLGVNLPIEGSTYTYQNQRYVLWETTNKNIRPGIIQPEISNTNYWKISLKSKQNEQY